MSRAEEAMSSQNYTDNCLPCPHNQRHDEREGVFYVECAARQLFDQSGAEHQVVGGEVVEQFRQAVVEATEAVGYRPNCNPLKSMQRRIEYHDNPLRDFDEMLGALGIAPEKEYGSKFLQILDLFFRAFPTIERQLQISIGAMKSGQPFDFLCEESELDFLGEAFVDELWQMLDGIFRVSKLPLSEAHRRQIESKLGELKFMIERINALRLTLDASMVGSYSPCVPAFLLPPVSASPKKAKRLLQ